MDDPRNQHAEEVALFRYGLIADLLHADGDSDSAGKKLYGRLREKADKSYCIPGSRRTRVAVETLKDWLDDYKARGFDALRPKPRKDIGCWRSPSAVIHPLRSSGLAARGTG